jgi:undecaprenyl diphosphate synthase
MGVKPSPPGAGAGSEGVPRRAISRRVAAPSDIEALRARVRGRPLPRHLAIIMDGNGRWAEARSLPRVAGHREGSASVRAVAREARAVGVEALTLYALSVQNLARPALEVKALMELLAEFLESERREILDNGIRLNAIGDLDRLPGAVRRRLDALCAESRPNRGMVLTLALSYDGREELAQAARRAARKMRADAIDAAALEAELWTAGLPELDLLVRTSGERRISNFLLWQCAYAELAFVETLWPDFRERQLLEALADYQTRERRFGLTGAQVREAADR